MVGAKEHGNFLVVFKEINVFALEQRLPLLNYIFINALDFLLKSVHGKKFGEAPKFHHSTSIHY